MNVIVLDYNENFIEFLDPDLLDITEQNETKGIRNIDVTYYMEDMDDAKRLFRMGNKIWISGDSNIEDCLYVINTEVRRDYFQENNVVFTAEDVIVELNYAPLFSQTDLTAKNGFTLSTTAGEINVTVNYNALKYWFGKYYNIGVVQDCLSTEISKITPTGTMTLMELLRYIEDETCNVFIPRYEKDQNNNIIHRYLDFMNPNGNNRNWECNFDYIPVETTPIEESTVGPMDDVNDEDDIVELPEYTEPVQHQPANIQLSLKDETGEVIDDLTWKASTLGVTNNADVVNIKLKYTNGTLTCTVNKKTYYAPSTTPTSTDIDSSTTEFIELAGTGETDYDETHMTSVSQDNSLGSNIILPNHTTFEIYDTVTDDLLYSHEINPVLGDIHTDILDLGYNTKNIEYEIDETDTYTSMSPIISLEDSNTTNALTRDDISTIINNWMELSVKKGDKIPMIVQRVSSNMTPTDANMRLSDVTKNYYARPLKPNDTDSTFEYFKGTAYWYAPFNKLKGALNIESDIDTGVEYSRIQTRPDITTGYGVMGTPKNGTTSTSEENKYAIYNQVVMALKDHMLPKINIKVDVANYKKGEYNNYGLYDHVYIKIPGFETLITATVSKTSKSLHDIGENTIELDNYNISTKVAAKETILIGDNVNVKNPKTKKLQVTLQELETDAKLNNKLVNLTVYDLDETGNRTFRSTFAKKTNNQGMVSLTFGSRVGKYEVEANYGGDIEYTPATAIYSVVVSGKKTTQDKTTAKSTPKKDKKKYKIVKTYWTKCGLSPDKKEIIAIAQPSGWDFQGKKDANGKKLKYQQLYKTVFKNYCPYCGKKGTLRFDAGKRNKCLSHLSRGYKRGVPEGEITCTHCDCDFDAVTGVDKQPARRWLTRTKKPVKSSKTERAKLVKTKLQYGTKKQVIKETKNNKSTKTVTHVGTVNKKVKEWALKKVGKKTGAAAAKALAVAVGKIHYSKYNGFRRKPSTVLNSGGNCCDQTRLYLMCCDAVGVSEYYTLKYVHVHDSSRGRGHVFAQLINKKNGKKVYVDCTHSPWWGTYLRGWGSLPGVKTNYPKAPL